MITFLQPIKFNKTELHDFFEEAFDYDGEDKQALNEWLSIDELIKRKNEGALFLAYDESKIIGGCFITKQNPITYVDGKKLEILILAVLNKYRNQGIASTLLKLSEEYAIQVGAQKIILNTHIDEKGAQAFYTKQGYDNIGILKNYYSNGDAVFFQKVLV